MANWGTFFYPYPFLTFDQGSTNSITFIADKTTTDQFNDLDSGLAVSMESTNGEIQYWYSNDILVRAIDCNPALFLF